ncbi:MAG TPA: DNA repair protein RadC [Kofleriaceae bacterium]|nr:DNA repair protein RadC [Kofleriaceae bacterium]
MPDSTARKLAISHGGWAARGLLVLAAMEPTPDTAPRPPHASASAAAWFRALADKPRERLLRDGARAISDSELIAILLGTGLRDHPVIEVADHVLRKIGGLASLAAASPHELAQIRGIGAARAARIAAAFELGRRVGRLDHPVVRLGSADDIFEHVAPRFAHEPQEVMLVLGLDTHNVLIDAVEIARGPAVSLSEPRNVFRPLLRMAAAGGVLVHNHPSGDLVPSPDDCSFTRHVRALGWLLGLPIVDHVIVSTGRFCSLAEWLGGDF